MDINHLVDLQQQAKDISNELSKALRKQLPDGTRITVDPPIFGQHIVTSSGLTYDGCLWIRTDDGTPHLIDAKWIVS